MGLSEEGDYAGLGGGGGGAAAKEVGDEKRLFLDIDGGGVYGWYTVGVIEYKYIYICYIYIG